VLERKHVQEPEEILRYKQDKYVHTRFKKLNITFFYTKLIQRFSVKDAGDSFFILMNFQFINLSIYNRI